METKPAVDIIEAEPEPLEEQEDYIQPIDHASLMTVEQARKRVVWLDKIKQDVLRPGKDYDVIPGAGNKPTLLKPGAERLLQFFGLGHKLEVIEEVKDWKTPFFYFEYKVKIIKEYPTHAITVAECIGSCNSKEAKYAYRWVPKWEAEKKGYDLNQLPQKKGKYRIPNEEIYDLVNTIQKMAVKRALIGATLQATGSSQLFTQDIEENPSIYGFQEHESDPKDLIKRIDFKEYFEELCRKWKLTGKVKTAFVYSMTGKENLEALDHADYASMSMYLSEARVDKLKDKIQKGGRDLALIKKQVEEEKEATKESKSA